MDYCHKLTTLFFVWLGLLDAQPSLSPQYKTWLNGEQNKGYYFIVPIRTDARMEKFKAQQLILNEYGNLIYFKEFSAGTSPGNFQLQKNGLISYYDSKTYKHYLKDNNFKLADSVVCKNGFSQDGHAFEILENGNYLLIGYETVDMDLSMFKVFGKKQISGSRNAHVKAGIIQELDKNRNVVFEWHSKDYYHFLDIDTTYLTDSLNVDWTHYNALIKDKDGNYLVSARNFNEITKINAVTGKIMWRLGGNKNQFKFINDSSGFCAQHDVRRTNQNTITLFDNGKPEPFFQPAAAKEYVLNEQNLTCELVWKYINNPKAHSFKGLGNVAKIKTDQYLINYGTSNTSNIMLSVVDVRGNKKFELEFNDTLRTYRAFYYDETLLKIKQPQIKCMMKGSDCFLQVQPEYSEYLWSNGSKSKKIQITKPGKYSAFVPAGDGGYFSSKIYEIGSKNGKCYCEKTPKKK